MGKFRVIDDFDRKILRHVQRNTVIDLHHTIAPPTSRFRVNGARLLARSVDGVAVEQVLSTRFRSAAAFDGRNCPDLRTACGP